MVRIYGKANLSELEKLDTLYSELQKKESKKKIVYVEVSSSTIVAAGTSETIILQPPQSKSWRIINMVSNYLPAPPGATTGSHQWQVVAGIRYFYFRSYYSDHLEFADGFPTVATAAKRPDTALTDYPLLIKQIKLDNNIPLELIYRNNTDADQTNARSWKFVIEEEDEAS